MPDVTIIIPAYNSERFLPATLQSLLVQRGPQWRAIVVDDGSTDSTAVLASAFDSRIEILSQKRQGVSRARNAGAWRSVTEYLLFLDADDILKPDALSRLERGLSNEMSAAAAFGTFDKILPDGSPYPGQGDPLRVRYPEGNVLRAILRHNFLANGGHVLLRTAHVIEAGGFDPGLRLSEDWEFWSRLALQGPFVFVAGAPVMSLRVHRTSTSGSLSREWTNHLPALEKVKANVEIRNQFSAVEWCRLEKAIVASHMWEAGRVNFTYRDFSTARRLMLSSLRRAPTLKRIVLFILAQISQFVNRSLTSRLRFIRDDRQEL